jgi:hypothetical protein
MALEDELRIEIPTEAVQRAVTVADVIAAVDAESGRLIVMPRGTPPTRR